MTVMISYSSADEVFAGELKKRLTDEKLPVWIDQEGIEYGTAWRDELISQLQSCDTFVAVLSKNYLKSEHCRMELFLARTFERRILPVMLDDCWNALDADESTRGLRDLFMVRMFDLKIIGMQTTRDDALLRVVDAAADRITRKAKRPIYITHLNGDAKLATDIAGQLGQARIPTWVATLDTPVGADWRRLQSRALADAACQLVILNAGFTSHPIVRTELLIAEALGLPIFPALHPNIANDRPRIESLNRELSTSDRTYQRVYQAHAAKISAAAPFLDDKFIEALRKSHTGRRKLF